jgi:hypothetical protein
MPTATSRRSNGSRRERILNYLSSQGGRIDSVDGRGLTSKMAARVGYDNIAALNAILARLERDGEIKRVVRGKRTYSIALRGRASRPASGRSAAGRAVAASSARRPSSPRRASSPRRTSSPRAGSSRRSAATPRRVAAKSAPSPARRRSAPASRSGNSLPQLLAALGNELLALRAQNEDISRRITALESAVRPASRRSGSRRVA